MQFAYLSGILLSSLAAVAWAVSNVAIRVGTDDGAVSNALAVVMFTNAVVITPIAAVVHYPDYGLSARSAVAFATAGLAGLLLGRICLFRGIRTVGASRTTPVVSASALVSAVLAVQFLDETLTSMHAVGILLIVAGIALISWLMAADDGEVTSVRDVGVLLVLPLGAAFFIGVEPIFVRFGLDSGTPILVGLAVMSVASLVGYVLYRRLQSRVIELPWHSSARSWYLLAGTSSTIGLASYFLALTVAPVVVVIPIIQLSPLVVLVVSALFLSRRLERVTWRLAAAAVAVIAGATLVSLSG